MSFENFPNSRDSQIEKPELTFKEKLQLKIAKLKASAEVVSKPLQIVDKQSYHQVDEIDLQSKTTKFDVLPETENIITSNIDGEILIHKKVGNRWRYELITKLKNRIVSLNAISENEFLTVEWDFKNNLHFNNWELVENKWQAVCSDTIFDRKLVNVKIWSNRKIFINIVNINPESRHKSGEVHLLAKNVNKKWIKDKLEINSGVVTAFETDYQNSNRFFFGNSFGSIRICDSKTQYSQEDRDSNNTICCLSYLEGNNDPTNIISGYKDDKECLMVGCVDGDIFEWRNTKKTNDKKNEIWEAKYAGSQGSGEAINAVYAFRTTANTNAKKMITAGANGTLCLWILSWSSYYKKVKWNKVEEFGEHYEYKENDKKELVPVSDFKLLNTGKVISCGDDKKIRFWDGNISKK
jgi:hypothetical protein